MRRLSQQGDEFSFSFMSYSEETGKSHGMVDVQRARFSSRISTEHNRNAEIMERYVNLDTGEARWFYQPLLMLFNNNKVELT